MRNSSSSQERYFVNGEHFYQPSREPSHVNIQHLQTPKTEWKDQIVSWNERIAQECYIPQLQDGTLEEASFDFYATIRREMLKLAPKESVALRNSMRIRGVGDPFLHILLPDLSERDKTILVRAGWNAFKKDAGEVAPQWFWAPETALDNNTLEVLAEIGYKGVICAPDQIDGVGGKADNYPVRIKLKSGRQFLALPFDRPISQKFAFGEKTNADQIAHGLIKPRILQLPKSVPLIEWTDGETFGHHDLKGHIFLYYLLKQSLPSMGVAVLGINDLPDVWEKADYKSGFLRERTAWSCQCGKGNLSRWHTDCGCCHVDGTWKESFSMALENLNSEIDRVLDSQLNKKFWPDELANNFDKYFYFAGGRRNNKSSLLAAKASALGARISCGTFYDDPGTSGSINMLFARQTLEHLTDAGFGKLAQELKEKMLKTLTIGIDPHSKKTLAKFFAYYFN